MKTLVTGATGFLGRQLCAKLLSQNHSVIALTRSPERAQQTLGKGITCLAWQSDWAEALQEVDVVFHLAGESVAGGRWTPDFKQKIGRAHV